MAGPDDLKEHAASKEDFYALLGLEPTAQDNEIRRAYRRTALKYHPDKIANPTPADIDKFHLLQIAYDVLSEPSVRQLYDNAREARERKKRETEMLAGARRKMKEDLEARERGVKRSWDAANADAKAERAAQDMLEAEIRRLAKDGARRRRQKEELLKREILEEEERIEQEREARERAREEERKAKRGNAGGNTVPEEDRMIKVRWPREGLGVNIDKDRLTHLFSRFGKIESAFLLKDKKQRLTESHKKKIVATGVIVYASIVGAHAAVQDSQKQRGDEWDAIYSVEWAKGQPPNFSPAYSQTTSSNTEGASNSSDELPKKPTRNLYSFPGLNLADTRASTTKGDQTGKAPSFASFSSATAASKNQTTSAEKPPLNGPSLEEITLIRLREAAREAEKKKLEQQLKEEDEKADVAERTEKNA